MLLENASMQRGGRVEICSEERDSIWTWMKGASLRRVVRAVVASRSEWMKQNRLAEAGLALFLSGAQIRVSMSSNQPRYTQKQSTQTD